MVRMKDQKVYIPSIPKRWDEATGSRVPSIDLNPAAQYGELKALSSNQEEPLYKQIEQAKTNIKGIDVDDYILCVGDIVLTAVAICEAVKINKVVRLLRWDRKRHGYDEVEVKF